jgi:protein-disulfide isomerase
MAKTEVVLGNVEMQIDTSTEEGKAAFNAVMDAWQDEQVQYIQDLAEELNISDYWAMQVAYLRTRSRHTPELEQKLLDLARSNTTNGVNMNEWLG